MGLMLGESTSTEFAGAIAVVEVSPSGTAAQAQVQTGDILRACTACKMEMEMEMPTWQIIAGGIGRPKTKHQTVHVCCGWTMDDPCL
jgi:hypothetical protein